ncbi:Xanthan lyase [hydrothermal vent metagenome]|uniref:Xanthan lyase n=1 Tax=hydrothermal vent metagenome TaxID=652676 RepID=A0A3B0UAE9_9ZZZZ
MANLTVRAYSPHKRIVGHRFIFIFLCLAQLSASVTAQNDTLLISSKLKESLNTVFSKPLPAIYSGPYNYQNGKKAFIDSISLSRDGGTLELFFNNALAEMPVRDYFILQFKDSVYSHLPPPLGTPALKIFANGVLLEGLVPNYYRSKGMELDSARLPLKDKKRKAVVKKDRPFEIPAGLANSNIALWHSHGWYYESKQDRWEWQRARLFTTVEDIFPASFVIPFLVPMLENAGANTFLPRERDWQENEVIVDNDGSTGKSKFYKPKRRKKTLTGFALGDRILDNENPFLLGTAIAASGKNRDIVYLPEIPEEGWYGVYVSYAKGGGEVTYRVYHSGGFTDFKVDQRIGSGTWIYLDKFHFKKGRNKQAGKVVLLMPANKGQIVTADAVRFGGGMGLVRRNGRLSGRAKFFEGARYYLQYAGAPDTLTWDLSNGGDDYKDDYKCRGEWVDWLIGKPFGPTKNRGLEGLGIPIDLAFAFHTDAGITKDSSVIGTLAIYSTESDKAEFPDGQSKYASRDLSDLVQSQIVDDINSIYKCNWVRRGMWNAQYSEAYRPNVPTMLLELLSHQNLNDMRYGLNPKFKFDVSRAVYKGMLRFIATQNRMVYVVQPLPVDHLFAEFTDADEITLKWSPVTDPLEPSAKAEKYMVYKRIGGNGFDNGTLTDKPGLTVSKLKKGVVYGFKVTAVNAGGESFPSEVVSVGIPKNSKGDVLIVNGFDRVDSPVIFDSDSLAGVLRTLGQGVAYGFDLNTTGGQYDFNKNSEWLDDDSPGHGASYADLETTVFRGNTFDFSAVHGESILNAGYRFSTSSDEAVEQALVNLPGYSIVDLLYGEEKTSKMPGNDSLAYYSIYSEGILSQLEGFAGKGGSILISGAYIGSDILNCMHLKERINSLFGFKWRTGHAVKNGQFYSVNPEFDIRGEVNTGYNLKQYPAEAPDGIEPAGRDGKTFLRYSENNVSAGVAYKRGYKVVALGFPFECVRNRSIRDTLIKQIFNYFNKD